ncbi:MAG: hypothetical protein ACREND_14735 [Gemmatimonadaceae bacterium]
MRRTLLGVPAVVVLAACMHTAPRETAPPPDPLNITLLPALAANTVVPSLTFALNRPAYVAAFEVIPGRGARLLYPYAPDVTPNPGGMNLVTETPAFYDDYLRSALGMPGTGATYTYVVASEQPLRLGDFLKPSGLLTYFGDAQFASYRASTLIDGLTAAVIPADAPDDSWSADMVVDWSNAPLAQFAQFALAPMSIACDNGSVLTVPPGYGSAMCPVDAVRIARTTVVAKNDAPRATSNARGRPVVRALAKAPSNAEEKQPRRRPWWYGNPGRAWVGDLAPAEMSPVFVTGTVAMHSTSTRTTAERTSAARQTASSHTEVRAQPVSAAPAPARQEIRHDAPRKPQ